MDTITSIKLSLMEWIAEDPEVRKYSHLNTQELNRVLKRATELQVQFRRLFVERCMLEDHTSRVDQGELIISELEYLRCKQAMIALNRGEFL